MFIEQMIQNGVQNVFIVLNVLKYLKPQSSMLSHPSGRNQCVKITNSLSLLNLIMSGVPTGINAWTSIIKHLMNDIFFLLGSDLHNFADDNTVTAVAETIQGLIKYWRLVMPLNG